MDNTELLKKAKGSQYSFFSLCVIPRSHSRFQQEKPTREVLLAADYKIFKELSRSREGLLKRDYFQAVTNFLAQAKGDSSDVYNQFDKTFRRISLSTSSALRLSFSQTAGSSDRL